MADMKMPDMKLELVPIGVSDIERAKAFYNKAGFKEEVDTEVNLPKGNLRVIQFTPPGSACSIVFGTGMEGISDIPPGIVKGLHLVVDNLDVARKALVNRGIKVAEPWDISGVKYASFSDPDDNLWLLQEFPAEMRRPGQSFYGKS